MNNDPLGMQERDELKSLGFNIPDSVTPVVAYRSWKLWPWTDQLLSNNGCPWTPGQPMVADCIYECEKGTIGRHCGLNGCTIPCEHCSCGIYAAKKDQVKGLVPVNEVYGEVYLWGKVLEGPRGYRATFAYPKQFFVRDKKIKNQLERLGFGVPITVVGGSRRGFPFPRSRLARLGDPVANLFAYVGCLPALTMAVVITVTEDLSKTPNLIAAVALYTVGLAALVITVMLQLTLRRLRT